MISDKYIHINNLHKSFNGFPVLTGIDLDIPYGSSLAILGVSGSGKSILIKSIIGLITPDSGEIVIDGLEVHKLSLKEKFKLMVKCGFLFQGGALFDSLSVGDNITFFAELLYKINKKDKRRLALEKLAEVSLPERIIDLYPSELSGGMQKRLALARLICTNPKIMFFDEPTTGLDPITSNVINDLIIKFQHDPDVTSITVTHDLKSAAKIASHVALINEGKIIWKGNVEEMKNSNNPYIKQFRHGNIKGLITT